MLCRLVAIRIFQFTPLREGRPAASQSQQPPADFNSRPSARGDACRARRGSGSSRFQFTPLREGRPSQSQQPPAASRFQFTPLREGRQPPARASSRQQISIHAPPRGATPAPRQGKRHAPYFNSRPSARGDCPDSHGGIGRGAVFQFTPLREGRPDDHDEQPPQGDISIHAPPRGATGLPRRDRQGGGISIHAPPRGATAKDMQFLQIFCSTLTNQHGLTIMPRNLSRLFW